MPIVGLNMLIEEVQRVVIIIHTGQIGKVNISAVPKYPKFIHAAVFTAAAFSL